MSPREILAFVISHTALKSFNALSRVSGMDPGNLHGRLTGKRPLPAGIAQRVAAAIGLEAMGDDDNLQIRLVRGAVLNLEVEGTELQQLSELMTALGGGTTWLFVGRMSEPEPGEPAHMLIARQSDSYVVVSVRWPSIESAVEGYDTVREKLPGIWLQETNDDFVLSTGSSEWIRLRAGVESVRSLDQMFQVPTPPTVEQWARMLVEMSRLGIRPVEITELVREYLRPYEVRPRRRSRATDNYDEQ